MIPPEVCPKCKRQFQPRYDGVAGMGCDKCLGIILDIGGHAWLPGETSQLRRVLDLFGLGKIFEVTRAQAFAPVPVAARVMPREMFD